MISVVIPTHNRIEGLKSAIDSVFNQTQLPKEIIVVDDGSLIPVDTSVFSQAPAGIICKLLRNKTPKGGNHARNRGVLEASNEWISFLDDDDVFREHKIEEVTKVASENCVDIITSHAEVNIENKYFYKIRPAKNITFKEQLVRNLVGMTSMVCIRKSKFIEVGGFDESLPARQDYETWLRMLKLDAKYCCINRELVNINMSFSTKSVSKSIENNLLAIREINNIYKADLEMLSQAELIDRDAAISVFMAHKFLMSGQNIAAAKHLLREFLKLNRKNLLLGSILSLFGRNLFFFVFTKVK